MCYLYISIYASIYIINKYASHPSHSSILSESSAPPHIRHRVSSSSSSSMLSSSLADSALRLPLLRPLSLLSPPAVFSLRPVSPPAVSSLTRRFRSNSSSESASTIIRDRPLSEARLSISKKKRVTELCITCGYTYAVIPMPIYIYISKCICRYICTYLNI